MPAWDAGLYLRFADERARPAADLISRIDLNDPVHIVDIGCGPGNSTNMLHQRWPQATMTGVDNSAEMLAQASSAYPGWSWIQADAATWTSGQQFDLVFSNAALHWVPNHARLFPRLFDMVAPGGAFAIQMPSNFNAPSHRVMAEVAQEPLWRNALQNASAGIGVESLSFYYDLLHPLASSLDLWETEYLHILDGPEAILEWIRGTGMRPYLQALENDQLKKQFQSLCLERLREAYPRRPSGKVLFPFRRIFVIAYRSV
ncbi:MAG TPA: trans-aconitate 2-methyltransferase [Candidatus Angelobacter sp.]|jgi:trans-aconitate 2-methyltransferase|nr:trans-aconitate 2-methyltransferase [Candidatus Angelobacter sp.]